ncbi:hypothetical protein L2D01_03900 [Hyphomonadaceae bacterium ML37]|nr:hypothetical protein L2D01_03900 [Hyphomonadaceae bacterium ML37]
MLNSIATAGVVLLLAAAPAHDDIRIEQADGVWRVSADDQRLGDVLHGLGAQAGFTLTGAERFASERVFNVALEGSLEHVLQALLRDRDYVLVYDETAAADTSGQRLVLLSGRMGADPTPSQRPEPQRLADSFEASPEDTARLAAMLQNQVQPYLFAEQDDTQDRGAGAPVSATGGAAGAAAPDRGPAGDAAQPEAASDAQMAEATRRAQADLRALVNALRQHESQSSEG